MTCEVYRDLLVPYMEETCSEETAKMVKAHLEQCEHCKKELENYQKEMPVEAPGKVAKENKPSKPFRKIKKHIVSLWVTLAILCVVIGVVGSYFAVGNEHGFYVADQKFFHIKDEDILCWIKEDYEHTFLTMYSRIYFQIIDQEQYYAKEASFDEISKKSQTISNAFFDYEHATIFSDADSPVMIVRVPVHVEGDDVPMEMYIEGQRDGIGKYTFVRMQISREDVLDLGYCYYPYMTLMSSELTVWPGIETIEKTAFAFTKPDEKIYAENDFVLTDTKKKLEPGVYRWEEDDRFEEITVYEDGTLTRTGDYVNSGKSADGDISNMQLLRRIRVIDQPARYFIAQTQDGRERLCAISGMGLATDFAGLPLEIVDEKHIYIQKNLYEKIK